MADLQGLKSYLRFMPDDDVSAELVGFLAAAESYVAGAGIPKQSGNQLYDILVYMISAHWYNSRGVFTDAYKVTEIPMGAVSILNQLRSKI